MPPSLSLSLSLLLLLLLLPLVLLLLRAMAGDKGRRAAGDAGGGSRLCCTGYGLRGTMPPSPLLSLSLQAYCVFRVVVGGLVVTRPHRCAVVAVSNAIPTVGVGVEVRVGGRQATGHRGWVVVEGLLRGLA